MNLLNIFMTEFVKVKKIKILQQLLLNEKKKNLNELFLGKLIQITRITCKNKCSNNLQVTLDEQLQIYS